MTGEWHFCPACGRPAKRMDWQTGTDEEEPPYCTCCERPWFACPCTPASEGECKAIAAHGEREQ